MCGIAGILDLKGNNIEYRLLKAMCRKMEHRGPDDEGVYIGPQSMVYSSGANVGLGHRRLSIIDLSPAGHQPMCNEDKTVWIVMNGEIYNFLELKEGLIKKGHCFKSKTDTEVILHLYEEKGMDCVKDLRGMFAFAIWDEKQASLMLARDRLGKKPLLYTFVNNKLIFASEFKALLTHPEVSKDIDFAAMHHYLTYLCIPGPLTMFKNIKKLPPAHIMMCKGGKQEIKKYWELDFSKKIKIAESEALEQLNVLLEDAVKIRLISDVPLGVLLSGGVDSSCITGLMERLQGKGVHTFSIGFNEDQFNELPYAQIVANRFKTDHHYYCVTPDVMDVLPELIDHYGEPFADSSALPTYYACKISRRNVKVVLNGDGGDEVFAGYRRHLAANYAEIYGSAARLVNRSPLGMFFNIFPDRPTAANSPGNIRRFLSAVELDRAHRYMRWIGFFDEDSKQALYTDELRSKTKGANSCIFLQKLFDEAKDLDSIDSALYIDIFFGLQNDLLVKMDIASMANSLETRSPLLDHKLMEFSASLPSSFKIRNSTLKYIFKKSLKGFIPDKILQRQKRGFAVPVDKWFREDLKNHLISIILSSKAINRGYFKADVIKRMIEKHISRKENYGQHLWGLLVLELWHRRFIDA